MVGSTPSTDSPCPIRLAAPIPGMLPTAPPPPRSSRWCAEAIARPSCSAARGLSRWRDRSWVLDRGGPMNESTLWSAILAAPQADPPRQVYADWLESQGRLDCARVVRAEIAVHR